MSGPVTWVDDTTAWVVLAIPVADAYDAPRWAEVLRAAGESADGDWSAFESRVGDLALEQNFDSVAVAEFVATAANAGGFTAVESVLELDDQLPVVLTGLRDARQGANEVGAEAEEGPFGWVTDAQRTHVEQLWASAWQEYLGTDLDQRWGEGWQAHPAEHKVAWLDDLIAAGTLSGTGARTDVDQAADQDPFAWVTEEQRAHLAALWADQWPSAVTADLDQRWGQDWQAHPAEHKSAWLNDLITAGTLSVPADPSAAGSAMADLLASMRAVPGAESLSDEEVAQIVAETIGKAGS
ncbi:hypothetical protein [Actinophytocola oryzae]|uniref:Uncharacterized protein n=1 Tax=Actinophytocola oryzae TaxID=502181 RepID=A0A4R7VL49_9PSEU|nr:hypothetical protein [Actinophytocola oryzae]TDV49958.1 hypothetical protein CLV71_107306 [Actinophytocola oryzae]